MQLLQEFIQTILTIAVTVYALTLTIKVARHVYLYISLYKGVKLLLCGVYGKRPEGIPSAMAYLLAADVLVLIFVHPIGLVKCGAKWVIHPIDLTGKPIDARHLVDELLRIT